MNDMQIRIGNEPGRIRRADRDHQLDKTVATLADLLVTAPTMVANASTVVANGNGNNQHK